MNKLSTVMLALVTTLAFVPGAKAHDVTGTYTIGTTPIVSLVCSPDCLLVNSGINIGGFTFPGINEIGVTATIADNSGGPVSFTICQDMNGALCGEAGIEPRIDGCGTVGDLTKSAIAFVKNVPISVFVRATSQDCLGSTAIGGTITLTYSP